MITDSAYIIYTFLFCLPPIFFLWTRKEFYEILKTQKGAIAASTLLLTIYGVCVWVIAEHMEMWFYGKEHISGIIYKRVLLDDVIWWVCVSFLFSSFIAVASRYEEQRVDIVLREAQSFWNAVRYAGNGVVKGLAERNIGIEYACAFVVVITGFFFRITRIEWCILVFAISCVIGAEYFNTAIEKLAAKKEYDENTKLVKDLSAAAVAIVVLCALVIGGIIFVPRLLPLLFTD